MIYLCKMDRRSFIRRK